MILKTSPETWEAIIKTFSPKTGTLTRDVNDEGTETQESGTGDNTDPRAKGMSEDKVRLFLKPFFRRQG
jgi:hypothetical protein